MIRLYSSSSRSSQWKPSKSLKDITLPPSLLWRVVWWMDWSEGVCGGWIVVRVCGFYVVKCAGSVLDVKKHLLSALACYLKGLLPFHSKNLKDPSLSSSNPLSLLILSCSKIIFLENPTQIVSSVCSHQDRYLGQVLNMQRNILRPTLTT